MSQKRKLKKLHRREIKQQRINQKYGKDIGGNRLSNMGLSNASPGNMGKQ